MEYCRTLEVTLLSANNLPNTRRSGRMKVYAQVSIDGQSKTAKCTNVDEERGTNPEWNFNIVYLIKESLIQQQQQQQQQQLQQEEGGIILVVKLFRKGTLGDRLIGHEMKIPMDGLSCAEPMPENRLSCVVPGTGDGTTLNIVYKFGEKSLAQFPKRHQSGWDWFKIGLKTVFCFIAVADIGLVIAELA